MKPNKLKKYFKDDLISLLFNGQVILGRVAEVARNKFFVTVLNKRSGKLVTIQADMDMILGKLPEEANKDFIPKANTFALGTVVTWTESGEDYFAKVIDTKGHKAILQLFFSEDLADIPLASLVKYNGSVFADRNSLPELEGFYIKNLKHDEDGNVLGFVVAHEEVRVASVFKTDCGYRLGDLDIKGGHVKFDNILRKWMELIKLESNEPVMSWFDWLTNAWLPNGISDYQYAEQLKLQKAA